MDVKEIILTQILHDAVCLVEFIRVGVMQRVEKVWKK